MISVFCFLIVILSVFILWFTGIVEAYWIRDYAIENNMADPGEVIARCTNCNWFALHDSYDRLLDYYKRCPHCGAHMKSAKGIDEKLIDVKPYVYE